MGSRQAALPGCRSPWRWGPFHLFSPPPCVESAQEMHPESSALLMDFKMPGCSYEREAARGLRDFSRSDFLCEVEESHAGDSC